MVSPLHQHYTADPPTTPYRLLAARSAPEAAKDQNHALSRTGERLRDARVRAVYLVHGTFVGNDPLGVASIFQRLWPEAADTLRQFHKSLADRVIRDVGNYTEQFASRLQQGISGERSQSLPVRRFVWSGENHHLARFDAALRLIEDLVSQNFQPGDRVMLWGHSHAGNVFALMSQLLSGEEQTIESLLDAVGVYLRGLPCDATGRSEKNARQQYFRELLLRKRALADVHFDAVTFGTPIRYAWNTSKSWNLLHIVYHRPTPGLADYLTCFPPTWDEVNRAAHGDYVQQIGIAGSNTIINPLCWRAVLADRRLHRLLQCDIPFHQLWQRLKLGMRVPCSGCTLLIDYGRQRGNMLSHIAGHGVYTRDKWMAFHAGLISRQLYEP